VGTLITLFIVNKTIGLKVKVGGEIFAGYFGWLWSASEIWRWQPQLTGRTMLELMKGE
jgi:hypothetical protein